MTKEQVYVIVNSGSNDKSYIMFVCLMKKKQVDMILYKIWVSSALQNITHQKIWFIMYLSTSSASPCVIPVVSFTVAPLSHFLVDDQLRVSPGNNSI